MTQHSAYQMVSTNLISPEATTLINKKGLKERTRTHIFTLIIHTTFPLVSQIPTDCRLSLLIFHGANFRLWKSALERLKTRVIRIRASISSIKTANPFRLTLTFCLKSREIRLFPTISISPSSISLPCPPRVYSFIGKLTAS